MNVFAYMNTYGGPELFLALVVIILTPLVYWLVLKKFKWFNKIISIVFLWFIAMLIAYWDVYQIAKESERLCRQEAGLHVYSEVEAEGFIGYATDIEHWSEYGFKYVEGFYKNNKTRLTIKDGEVIYESIPEYISNYYYKKESSNLDLPIVKGREMIVEQKTNKVLGEVISFKIFPGWLDSRLLGLLSFSWTPLRCDGAHYPEPSKRTIYYEDLIKAVIKPKVLNEGDK